MIKKLQVYFICLLGLLFLPLRFFAQDSIQIKGSLIHNTIYSQVVVKQFGVGEMPIGVFPIENNTGNFRITTPKDLRPGVYRFQYGQTAVNDYIDVIINGRENEITFSIDVANSTPKRFPIFTKSAENIAWYRLDEKLYGINQLIEKLHDFLATYPNPTDKAYVAVEKEYFKTIKEYKRSRLKFIQQSNPFFWAKQMAYFSNSYFPNPKDHWRLQQYNSHQYFWLEKPTTDERLLNSPLYTQSILDYIQYFMNPEVEFSENEMNEGFEKCVDTIVNRFSGNEQTKTFAINYLQLGFKEIGNERLLQYIDQKYAIQLKDASENELLFKRIAAYERLAPFQNAPDFKWANAIGDSLNFSDLKGNEILLVFWSSDCPHCLEELPQVNEYVEKNKGTIVLAINVDEDKNRHYKEAANFNNMFHYNDLKGIHSPACEAYNVFATPTYFRINKDFQIINKYEKFNAIIN